MLNDTIISELQCLFPDPSDKSCFIEDARRLIIQYLSFINPLGDYSIISEEIFKTAAEQSGFRLTDGNLNLSFDDLLASLIKRSKYRDHKKIAEAINTAIQGKTVEEKRNIMAKLARANRLSFKHFNNE